jgi:hypothetical protein
MRQVGVGADNQMLPTMCRHEACVGYDAVVEAGAAWCSRCHASRLAAQGGDAAVHTMLRVVVHLPMITEHLLLRNFCVLCCN